VTITREQVQDLQPGDVVELRLDDWEAGQAIRGPLALSDVYPDVLEVRIPGGDGRYWVRSENGRPFDPENRSLTVISRAPRPLYVNHDRTEPVEGDIVRDCDGDAWRFEQGKWWCASVDSCEDDDPDAYPIDHYRPLTLLWDGTTGQVVP
jgi:hypothetical protein